MNITLTKEELQAMINAVEKVAQNRVLYFVEALKNNGGSRNEIEFGARTAINDAKERYPYPTLADLLK